MVSARGLKFACMVAILQVVFVIFMGIFGEYQKNPDMATVQGRMLVYPSWQDVNVMIFIGFGLLMTFLKNYGFSATGVNMLIAVVGIQWSAIVIGFVHEGGDKFAFGIIQMAECSFATATVLISFGAVLGKTSPIQLLVMALFGIFFAQINRYIGVEKLHASDIGESMYLHMFGAYFGMAVARVLYNEDVEKSDKEGSVYHSDLFSIAGTLFLWIYWPSFNGGFAGEWSEVAIVNTFLSLCACTVMVFVTSSILNPKGRFDMVHVQNSTLAGGVAVGACANMPMEPYVAMIIGAITGPCSVLGYKYLSPFLASKFKLHDTCGVHNLHGIPAWIATIAAAVLAMTATLDGWGPHIGVIFSEMRVENDELVGRSPLTQGGYQIAAGALTMVFAIVTGLFTGFILKLSIWNAPREGSLFDDRENWELPEGVPASPIMTNAPKNNYETQQI